MKTILFCVIVLLLVALLAIIIYNCSIENFGNDMKLTVIPMCGIGNRLQVINKAMEFKNVKYIWIKYFACNCEWEDLFSEPKINFTKNLPKDTNFFIYNKNTHKIIDRFIKLLPYKIENLEDRKIYKFKNEKNITIIDCSYNSTKNNIYKLLRPSQKVEDKINTFFPKTSNKILGVHFRFSDNVKGNTKKKFKNNYIPILFKIKKHKDFDLFIASDNVEFKEKIKKDLPDRNIYTQNINITTNTPGQMIKERDSVEGMVESIADMFALARCNKLLGNSTNSTFFQTAKKIHDS